LAGSALGISTGARGSAREVSDRSPSRQIGHQRRPGREVRALAQMHLVHRVARRVEDLEAAPRAALGRALHGEGMDPVAREDAQVDLLGHHHRGMLAGGVVGIDAHLLVHRAVVAGQRHHFAEGARRGTSASGCAAMRVTPRPGIGGHERGLGDAEPVGQVAVAELGVFRTRGADFFRRGQGAPLCSMMTSGWPGPRRRARSLPALRGPMLDSFYQAIYPRQVRNATKTASHPSQPRKSPPIPQPDPHGPRHARMPRPARRPVPRRDPRDPDRRPRGGGRPLLVARSQPGRSGRRRLPADLHRARTGSGRSRHRLSLETVLIDATGRVDRLTLFDFGALPDGVPRVRQFDIPGLALRRARARPDQRGRPMQRGRGLRRRLSLTSRTDVEVIG
jgi:hypothetical protein